MESIGVAYTWGSARFGELGNGNEKNNEIVPFRLKINDNIIQVSSGGGFSALIGSSGKIYTFGCNAFHRTGHPITEDNILIPKQVDFLKPIIKISCGDWHLMVIDNEHLL